MLKFVCAGILLEFVFPEMNVRYIAVNDNEDTDKGLSDFVPFKKRLTSFLQKIPAVKLRLLFTPSLPQVSVLFSIAPFGYMRHPEEHNKLAVDPDFVDN